MENKKNKIFLKNYKIFLDFCHQVSYNNSCVEEQTHNQIANALLAQLVEHLTLNQGVQGSSPWRRIESTGVEDTGASGLVLFLCCKNWKQK